MEKLLSKNLFIALIAGLWAIIWLTIGYHDSPNDWYDYQFWIAFPGMLIFAAFVATAVVFAWIINPIKNYMASKNKKK